MSAEREPSGAGGLLLKRCRARIRPECAALGPYPRLPMRVGKPVTQEEVAEAVGISRQYYALMEVGRLVRVSATVLVRVADALMMGAEERMALFPLAPELRSASLTNRSSALIEAFGSLRRLTRPLWASTTEAEALSVLREYVMTEFAPDFCLSYTRTAEGWEWGGTGADAVLDRHTAYRTVVREQWSLDFLDDLHGCTLLTQPGDLMTRQERNARIPRLAPVENPMLAAHELSDVSWCMAYVRSQAGRVAQVLPVYTTPYAFSEIERAQLSTLGELASLSLAAYASSPRR